MTHATGVNFNELPKALHTCYCGYSLMGAYEYLGGQAEVSRLMLDHLDKMHGVKS